MYVCMYECVNLCKYDVFSQSESEFDDNDDDDDDKSDDDNNYDDGGGVMMMMMMMMMMDSQVDSLYCVDINIHDLSTSI